MTDTPKARTSETHPLLISEIGLPDVCSDRHIAFTFLPGKTEFSPRGSWERDLEADLDIVRAWRPSDIILMPTLEEQGNLGVTLTKDMLIENGVYADLYQAPESNWPRPKDYLTRDIDALPPFMNTPGRRLLIIGRHGQERSAVLAVELLLRDGVYRDLRDAKSAVSNARVGSLATISQQEYLDHFWKRRQLKGGPVHSVCAIEAHKLRATRLRDMLKSEGVEITHSEALERLAHLEGLKNWNTLRARLHEAQIGFESRNTVTARWSLLQMFERSYGLKYLDAVKLHGEGNRKCPPPIRSSKLQDRYEDFRLSGEGKASSDKSNATIAWAIVEGVRSFFGEDDPNIMERISNAQLFGWGIKPSLVPEGGFSDVTEVPREVLVEISRNPGFIELVILHEAGYGTSNGRQHLQRATAMFTDFDVQKVINGRPHTSEQDRQLFERGVARLRRSLRGVFPEL